MTIRTAHLNDFSQLFSLWEKAKLKLYPQTIEHQKFSAMMQLNPHLCFAMEENNQIIGSILGAFDGRTVSIHRLAVDPQFQGKGIGTQLLNHLEQTVKNAGITKFTAQVHSSNGVVCGFYEKKGFKRMEHAVTFYKDL